MGAAVLYVDSRARHILRGGRLRNGERDVIYQRCSLRSKITRNLIAGGVRCSTTTNFAVLHDGHYHAHIRLHVSLFQRSLSAWRN